MSERTGTDLSVLDPDYLICEATILLTGGGAANTATPRRTIEDALRQANDLLHADFYLIDRLKAAKVEPDYPHLITVDVDEKIAALTFLAQRKLLAHARGQTNDQDTHDLATHVEILFRLQAADALIFLFDFAAAHEANTETSVFWHNVTLRCLYLLALLLDARPKVLALLASREDARQRLEELACSPTASVSQPCRALLQEAHAVTGSLTTPPPPQYITLFNQYYTGLDGNEVVDEEKLEQEVMEQMRRALENDEVAEIADTIAHAADAEAAIAFDALRTFATTELLIDVLEEVLNRIGVPPVRLAACVLELGIFDRATGIRGGMLRVNHLLYEAALTVMSDCIGVARLAVRELASVDALIDIERILDETSFVPVGEEAITALKHARVLPTSLTFLENRPDLRPAYLTARAELLEVKNLMEAAYAATTEDIALSFLTRLKELNAVPELRKLSQGNTRISHLAQKILVLME